MPATPAWPPRSAPRLFVVPELAEGAMVTLEGNPAHYLARVMRVAAGDTVILCDDITGEWAAEVAYAGKRHVEVRVIRQMRGREHVPDFWLCPALIKRDRFYMVLEKATELGAARIVPVITRRSVVDKLNLERAQTVVVEAAEQCARTALPDLAAPAPLDRLLRDWPAGRLLFFADEQGGAPVGDALRESEMAAILVGPEGGFDDAERAAIRQLPQARPISLGPSILRAETAALAATALFMALAGDWRG
ncbi:16S rRNA (uracil(1498)-N(3))-methyltransferase [Qipengyuania sp. YIM B01966]|uniref:16S rRNA (uracil(1498)-N(3))-methyltransferase n=1 Tax=Qipengyuania sp. YIM B01966 TaxID=2778646 RepID=UPI0018F71F28|nr:16S rRNA (uracil(1498)-N(3))-methyltransferase [Qipengyuania sp. YIM B01966]